MAKARSTSGMCFCCGKARREGFPRNERGPSAVVFLIHPRWHRLPLRACALVEWFKKVGRSPDTETGMWVVEPEMKGKSRLTSIVHLDTILRGAHLIPVYGDRHIPVNFRYYYSLDAFKAFHVNKYKDHHANEIAF
jgi:hypothetical protein